MIWLWCIAANLVSPGTFFDIAVRDIEISMGAFALAKLSEVRVRLHTVQPKPYRSSQFAALLRKPSL
jgi:hypothetical protein